ncbi:MAG: ATP-dependent 6-phosphofructokinase [Bacteroidia bacterium]|nr:MAG: ATP-dependent 6-phosphofructokinase [Bacteroidia bacterium]
MMKQQDFTIQQLGPCTVQSPMKGIYFADDQEHILYDRDLDTIKSYLDKGLDPPRFEAAGPREKIFFDPASLSCGIVTCGGLCPGINDVIRSIVLSLHHHYGVKDIYGFQYGYQGLVPEYGHEPVRFSPRDVTQINEMGGTILASSRGNQDPSVMVDTLEKMKIGILFCIGGDGTQHGALAISEEAAKRGLQLSVIGIPKTIDNDISFIQKTFGFETAVSEAKRATYAAHVEAVGAPNGIGLVKLMGRDSGFIAAYSVLVDNQVNFCLVPEVPFSMDAFLAALKKRLELRSHAVIVVAEGAGQNLFTATGERDASGNVKFGDIGTYLREAIKMHFSTLGMEVNIKYIDPSYIIRSQPANPHDSAFCLLMGHSAVHAGMAGRTGMIVGYWNNLFTHVPISLSVSERKKIDPRGWIWNSVLASTGQPTHMI